MFATKKPFPAPSLPDERILDLLTQETLSSPGPCPAWQKMAPYSRQMVTVCEEKRSERKPSTLETIHFHFALIASAIQELFPDASAAAYYRRIATEPVTSLDGSSF